MSTLRVVLSMNSASDMSTITVDPPENERHRFSQRIRIRKVMLPAQPHEPHTAVAFQVQV